MSRPHPLPKRPRSPDEGDLDVNNADMDTAALPQVEDSTNTSKSNPKAKKATRSRPPPRKKRRIAKDLPPPIKGCFITSLPLELLGEVASDLDSRDMLALARTSAWFTHTLLNSDSVYMWRSARQKILPHPLPRPPQTYTEPAWASFALDAGICDICGKSTNKAYNSFALKKRVCSNKICYDSVQDRYIAKNIHSLGEHKALATTILRDELTFGIDPNVVYTFSMPWTFRKDDWEAAVKEFEEARENIETLASLLKEYERRKSKIATILKYCHILADWRAEWENHRSTIRNRNDRLWKELATKENLNKQDLVNSPMLRSVLDSSNRQGIIASHRNWRGQSETIIAEAKELHSRRISRTESRALQKQYEDTKEHWHWLKSNAKSDEVVLPLSEFLKLPLMDVVKTKRFESTEKDFTLTDELRKKDSILSLLVQSNIGDWIKNTKAQLATALGYKGKKKKVGYPWSFGVHPVDRPTAIFMCRRCADHIPEKTQETSIEKTPNRAWRELDFKGVCIHVCLPGSGQSNSRPKWSIESFVADEDAIKSMKVVLKAYNILDEDEKAKEKLEAGLVKGLECKSCPQPIMIRAGDVIRHARRHEEFKVATINPYASRPIKYAKEGTVIRFAGRKRGPVIQHQTSVKRYACTHCEAARRPSGGSAKLLSFNGMRSHLKEKHEILRIGEEDFRLVERK